uniref:Actin-related protein 8 n=1 Tax=Macrostomum lignano TaxID=282301 RepID=A0A1I8HEF4_9PLAT
MLGLDAPALSRAVRQAVLACPVDYRRDVARCVLLCGGGVSLLPGLRQRLETELRAQLPCQATVRCLSNRLHATYLGLQRLPHQVLQRLWLRRSDQPLTAESERICSAYFHYSLWDFACGGTGLGFRGLLCRYASAYCLALPTFITARVFSLVSRRPNSSAVQQQTGQGAGQHQQLAEGQEAGAQPHAQSSAEITEQVTMLRFIRLLRRCRSSRADTNSESGGRSSSKLLQSRNFLANSVNTMGSLRVDGVCPVNEEQLQGVLAALLQQQLQSLVFCPVSVKEAAERVPGPRPLKQQQLQDLLAEWNTIELHPVDHVPQDQAVADHQPIVNVGQVATKIEAAALQLVTVRESNDDVLQLRSNGSGDRQPVEQPLEVAGVGHLALVRAGLQAHVQVARVGGLQLCARRHVQQAQPADTRSLLHSTTSGRVAGTLTSDMLMVVGKFTYCDISLARCQAEKPRQPPMSSSQRSRPAIDCDFTHWPTPCVLVLQSHSASTSLAPRVNDACGFGGGGGDCARQMTSDKLRSVAVRAASKPPSAFGVSSAVFLRISRCVILGGEPFAVELSQVVTDTGASGETRDEQLEIVVFVRQPHSAAVSPAQLGLGVVGGDLGRGRSAGQRHALDFGRDSFSPSHLVVFEFVEALRPADRARWLGGLADGRSDAEHRSTEVPKLDSGIVDRLFPVAALPHIRDEVSRERVSGVVENRWNGSLTGLKDGAQLPLL